MLTLNPFVVCMETAHLYLIASACGELDSTLKLNVYKNLSPRRKVANEKEHAKSLKVKVQLKIPSYD